jgi:quercetin dioxygenase-like cupin family protein
MHVSKLPNPCLCRRQARAREQHLAEGNGGLDNVRAAAVAQATFSADGPVVDFCADDPRMFRQVLVVAGIMAAAASLAASGGSAADGDVGVTVEPVAADDLSDLAGQRLTAFLVTYAPGGKSARHHHAGSVWVYLLSGAIRSQNSATGPAKVFGAGESFFEPPGSRHLVSENASATESAGLIATISPMAARRRPSSTSERREDRGRMRHNARLRLWGFSSR